MSSQNNNVKLQKIFIEKIIDCDIFSSNNKTFKLIGVDCPDFRMPLYDEIFLFIKNEIEGREVFIETCPIKSTDAYNHERVIIFYKDTRGQTFNLNLKLLKLGYARFYPNPPCHINFYEWAKVEHIAKIKKIGIWSEPNLNIHLTNNFILNNNDEEKDLGVTKISNKFFKLGYFIKLTDVGKVLYMFLCSMAHSSGIVWIAFTTIIKHTKYDINTVLMGLNELSSHGLISYKLSQNKNKPNYILLHKITTPSIFETDQLSEEVDKNETLDLF